MEVNSNETWRPVPGYPGYEASSLGHIRSFKRSKHPRLLRPAKKSRGYLFVGLRKDGHTDIKSVHAIITLAFIGKCPDGLEVCHTDSNPANNAINNLRYDTHLNNMQDAVAAGRMMQSRISSRKGYKRPYLARFPFRKLSDEDVRSLILDHKSGKFSYLKLASKYGVGYSTVRKICCGKRYKDVYQKLEDLS